jgi:predicted TIM-barrel fold metal-dependent hydrolase
MPEAILEPELPIIDPHHHLWDRRNYATPQAPEHPFMTAIEDAKRYLLDELMADTGSGHNVVGTVFLECGAFYKADGPVERRSIGETEFVNGVAAMSASGLYGDFRACAGIVGNVPLLATADAAKPILEAHVQAGGGRFRGIRNSASFDDDKEVLGPLNRVEKGLYLEPRFREGFRHLAPMGLSFDAWLLEPQLPDLIDLARAFPDTTIVLDHVGTPLGRASYAGKLEERFPIWRDNIRELARSPNVVVKLGGLAMAFCNFPSFLAQPRASSQQLADEWRPYIETCIEAFGPDRGMFESNFPVDMGACDYATLWNAFKRLAAGASADEKTALFSGTARRVYRLSLP